MATLLTIEDLAQELTDMIEKKGVPGHALVCVGSDPVGDAFTIVIPSDQHETEYPYLSLQLAP